MTFSVVDRKDNLPTETDRCIEVLERALDDLKSGRRKVTHLMVMYADMSDVDTLEYDWEYYGRSLMCVGLLQLMQKEMIEEVG